MGSREEAWAAAGGVPGIAETPALSRSRRRFSQELCDGGEPSDEQLMRQFARFQALQQPKLEVAKPVAVLDYDAALKGVGLQRLPFDRRPCPTAAAKLFALAEKAKKIQSCPFVFVKLEWFVPRHSRKGGVQDSEDESKTLPNRSRSPPPLTVAPALASGHPYNRHHLFQPARISPFQSFTSHFLPR